MTIEVVHIVMRHYKGHSSVDKTFNSKDKALVYASEQQRLEERELSANLQGMYTVVTSKLEDFTPPSDPDSDDEGALDQNRNEDNEFPRFLNISVVNRGKSTSLLDFDTLKGMPVIQQYIVKPSEQVQHISVPYGSKIVSCGLHDNQLVIWVMKMENHDDPTRIDFLRYMVVDTGQRIDSSNYFPVFRGTIQEGDNVWHVLEMQEYEI